MAFKVIGDAKKLTNEEWKSLRKIGGSTVGAIMGFNPYVSPYMVWEQFVNDEFPDIDTVTASAPLYYGNSDDMLDATYLAHASEVAANATGETPSFLDQIKDIVAFLEEVRDKVAPDGE